MIGRDKQLIVLLSIVSALLVLYAINAFFCVLAISLILFFSLAVSGLLFYSSVIAFLDSLNIQKLPVLKSIKTKEIVMDEPTMELLPQILPAQRTLLIGAQNAGKTTLLRHLSDAKAKEGKVYIVDPHGYPGKFNAGEVIGMGREYGTIAMFFADMLEEMNNRYKEYSAGTIGEREHERITIIADEWTLLYKECAGVIEDFTASALTEFRKVNIDLIIATHSRRAKVMNLQGAYDLFSGFDCIVTLKNEDNQRWAELEKADKKKVICRPPGPYSQPIDSGQTSQENLKTNAENSQDSAEILDLETPPEPRYLTDTHKTICEMHQACASFNKICQAVWGVGSQNGGRITKVKKILAQYGQLR